MSMTMTKKRVFSVIVLAFCGAVATAAQDREERISRTFDVGADGELSLSNISGDIRIEATSGTQIVLEAVKTLHGGADTALLEEVKVDISHMGDRVRVETRYPHHRDRRRNREREREREREGDHDHDHDRGGVSVEYRVRVPIGTEVEVSSVSGDVEVTGVDGETSVNSVSGDVRVGDAGHLVRAKSVSGGVEVERVRSNEDLEISSVSGDVVMVDVEAEELDVASVSGDVDMDEVWCEEGEFDSVSGEIRYTGRIAPGGRYEFKSHSGDVVITLGGEVGFELDASTFSGDIESDFEMRLSSDGRERSSVSGIVGDGSAVIEATTFSGDVILRRR